MVALHPRIAGRPVDIPANAAHFHPFVGSGDILDRGIRGERLEAPVDHNLVAEKVRRVLFSGRGSSLYRSSRAKARAFELHMSVAFQFVIATPAAMDVLGKVLGVREPAGTGGRHPADGWLRRDDDDVVDGVALKIIADVAEHGATPHSRRAVFWLLDWHRAEGRWAPVVAINALAMVLGVIDPATSAPIPRAMGHILSRDWKAMSRRAHKDAEAIAKSGNRLSPLGHAEPDDLRQLRRMRKEPAYERLVSAHLRDMPSDMRTMAELDRARTALVELAPAAWAKFRVPNGKRLADFRRTYWRLRRSQRSST